MAENTGPTFVGIGVQRGGTSWLYECLNEHPQVFMPRKEMHFFDLEYEKGTEWYREQFTKGEGVEASGEFTPDYMAVPEAIERLAAFDSDLKVIITLREPISRAYSAYNLYKSHGRYADKSFSEAIAFDRFILEQSLYSKQLINIFSKFKKENIYIALYEDIAKSPRQFFSSVCQFLGLDDSFVPSALKVRKNTSAMSNMQGKINLPAIQKKVMNSPFRSLAKKLKNTAAFSKVVQKIQAASEDGSYRDDIDPRVKEEILQDINRVEELTGLNLSSWK